MSNVCVDVHAGTLKITPKNKRDFVVFIGLKYFRELSIGIRYENIDVFPGLDITRTIIYTILRVRFSNTVQVVRS